MTRQIFLHTILFAVILTSCLPHKKTGKEYFDLGQDYENRGQLKNALKAYTKAIKKDHKQPYYFVKQAEMLYLSPIIYNNKKTYPKIEKAYNHAMHLANWYDKALLSRANFWYFHDNLVQSKDNLDSLIKMYPSNIDGHLLLAKIYFDKKDEINGIQNLNASLKKSNYSIDYLEKVGEIYQDYKKYQQAINLYRTALEKSDKVTFERYYSLAICYYRQNNIDSACYFFPLRNSKTCFGQECRDLEAKCAERIQFTPTR